MTRSALALLTLLCACAALALPSSAGAASSFDIIKDCSADGVLQGTYTVAELRKARRDLDGDALEYTDCDDVLRRAAAALSRQAQTPATGGAGTTTPAAPDIGTPADEPDAADAPTQFDKPALEAAQGSGDQAVDVGGVKLVPASGVRVDSSALPVPLIVSLAILALVGLACCLPGVRAKAGVLRPALERLRRR